MTNKNELWNHFQRQKFDALSESRRSFNETNQTERDLCGQLLLLATVLLAVIGAVLAADFITMPLTIAQSIVLVSCIFFLIGSVVSGIRYYFILINFNTEWSLRHLDIARLYEKMSISNTKEELNVLSDEINIIIDDAPIQTDTKWLHLEIGSLGLAGVSFIFALMALIFDWNGIFEIKL